MVVRIILAVPLIIIISTAATFLMMVSVPAPFVWGAVSVVAMVMVGAVALLALTRLTCPPVLIPGCFMKVLWRAGIQWRVGLTVRRCCVHFRNSLSPVDGAAVVVVAVWNIHKELYVK